MLPRKTLTKKQKKIILKKKWGVLFIISGIFIIVASLVYGVLFVKEPLYVSPLASDQSTYKTTLEQKLKEKKIEYKEIRTHEKGSYLIILKTNQEVILSSLGDIDQQLSSLQLVLSQLKIEGRTFKRLDFRYQKPIITF